MRGLRTTTVSSKSQIKITSPSDSWRCADPYAARVVICGFQFIITLTVEIPSNLVYLVAARPRPKWSRSCVNASYTY